MLIGEILKIIWFYSKRSIGQWKECLLAITATIREYYRFDKKFGVDTIGFHIPKGSSYGDELIYQASNDKIVNTIVDSLKMTKNDVFVDLGCGKGRILIIVGLKKIKKVIGVELDKKVIEIARNNINNLKLNTPVELVHQDAVNFNYDDGTIFFMFNSFGWKTLKKVIEKIESSLRTKPRKVSIVYLNPVFGNLLDACGWLTPKGEIDKTRASLWQSKTIS